MTRTIYHVTPITPNEALIALGHRAYTLSYARPDQLEILLRLAAWLMIDNGAFTAFTKGREVDWDLFWAWLETFLFTRPGIWFVIPDVIDAGSQFQDALLRENPFGHRGAPVWHMDEPIDRFRRLCDEYPRVCIGSTGEFWKVGSDAWKSQADKAMRATDGSGCARHMLRGVAVIDLFDFDSADASSLGQNGWRYDAPLFAASENERWRGRIAYADRLERRAA